MRTTRKLTATILFLSLLLCPWKVTAQDISVTSVDNYAGNSNVFTNSPNTEVTVTELGEDKNPVRSWSGKTDEKGKITIYSGSNLNKGFIKVMRASMYVEGFVVPSQVSDKEPFTFAAQGVVEGEVIVVSTVEGEVVATKKADKYGRVFLAAGLASGTYLLTSGHGGDPVTSKIQIQISPVTPQTVNPRPLGRPGQPALQKFDQPVTLVGDNINPDASKMTASLRGGGPDLTVLASSPRECVIASPGVTGHATVDLKNTENGDTLASQPVTLCKVQVRLAKKTLVSGEQTTLEFTMVPNDVDAKIDAQIIDGPVKFNGNARTTNVTLQNGEGSVPVQTIAGQAGKFHIGWWFSVPKEVTDLMNGTGTTENTETKDDPDNEGYEIQVVTVREYVDGAQVGGHRDTRRVKKKGGEWETIKHEVWDKDKKKYVVPPKK